MHLGIGASCAQQRAHHADARHQPGAGRLTRHDRDGRRPVATQRKGAGPGGTAGAEDERGDGDERVGGVEIAAEQEIARRAGVEMKRYYRKGDGQKYLFVLQDAEDVRLEGVTICNAPLWNVRLQDCNRVWIRGIFLYSDLERAVNSDGIDIVSSSNVLIGSTTPSGGPPPGSPRAFRRPCIAWRPQKRLA